MEKHGRDARSIDSGIGSSTGGSVYSVDSWSSGVSQREEDIHVHCHLVLSSDTLQILKYGTSYHYTSLRVVRDSVRDREVNGSHSTCAKKYYGFITPTKLHCF